MFVRMGLGLWFALACISCRAEAPGEFSKLIEQQSKDLNLPLTKTLDLGGEKLELVLVPPGEFMMGSSTGDGDEIPVHKVRITQPFYIGKIPVTVAQYKAFADAAGYKTGPETSGKGWTIKDRDWHEVSGATWRAPGFEQDSAHPVVLVNWFDARAFTQWAAKASGLKVRLPSEAEWEWAARGPKAFKYPWGADWDGARANHGDQTLKGSDKGNPNWPYSKDTDGAIFSSKAGAYDNASWCGALDMAGNVWNWNLDFYGEGYYVTTPEADPPGPAAHETRMNTRGGSWSIGPGGCRSANRFAYMPDFAGTVIGFRIALFPKDDPIPTPVAPLAKEASPLELAAFDAAAAAKNQAVVSEASRKAIEQNLAAGLTGSDWRGKKLPISVFLDSTGGMVDLTTYAGKNVVLLVMKGFWSQGICVYCTRQAADLAKHSDEIRAQNAEMLMIYPGAQENINAFVRTVRQYENETSAKFKLPFKLLMDVNQDAVKALNVSGDLAQPTTLVLDGTGIVRYQMTGKVTSERPSTDALLEELKKINAPK